MTTYTKETALYDTGAIAGDIQGAGEQASSYFTDISSGGVFVHEQNPNNPQPDSSTSNGVKITNKIDVIRSGESVAEFGDRTRIGKDENGYSRIIMDPNQSEDGITNIFSIDASAESLDYSVNAHKITFDETHTGTVTVNKKYNDEYILGGMASYDNPLTEVGRTLDVIPSFVLSDLDDIQVGDNFTIYVDVSYRFSPSVVDRYEQTLLSNLLWATFTKSSSSTPVTKSINYTVTPAQMSTSIGKGVEWVYTPSTNTISLTPYITALGSYVRAGIARFWINDIRISSLSYERSNSLFPIHELTGDVTVNGSLVTTGDFRAINADIGNVLHIGSFQYGYSGKNYTPTAMATLTNDSISIRTIDMDATVAANGYTTSMVSSGVPGVAGMQARCVVGFNIFNQSSGGANASLVFPYKMYIDQSEQTVNFTLRNTASSQAKVTVRIFMLYTKNQLTG